VNIVYRVSLSIAFFKELYEGNEMRDGKMRKIWNTVGKLDMCTKPERNTPFLKASLQLEHGILNESERNPMYMWRQN
jgi:hypothetical protein